ncbi:MAG: translocation protein TolB [Bdellovibrionia bacterium]
MRKWIFILSIFTALTVNAQSDFKIDLGKAQTKKSLIAFPALQFFGSPITSKQQVIGSELYNVILNDLTVSSYFQFIAAGAYLEDPAKTALTPAPGTPNGFNFQNWSAIGAEFLIRGGFSVVGDTINLEMYTYHVKKASLVFAKKYTGPASSARRIAHTYANEVLEKLTGTKGMFLSKIVTTSDRSGGKAREVFIMDWDGANPNQVTNHRSVTLSPAWSPDGKKIAYTAYVLRKKTKMRNPDLFVYDLASGRRYLTSYRSGMNSGASFAPDNKHIFLTISQGSSPDIYKMTFDGAIVSKLTSGPAGALNVEPAVSPDGRQIAFSSDRAGRPMIYTMNADGSSPKRITFAGAFNSSPAWSPDGKKIAFAGQSSNNFDIFVMNADGTNMVRITSARKPNGSMANNEDPSFSPDGRFVMYTSNRTGKNQIFISTVDGSEERRITFDNLNYFKPRWSQNIE